MTNYELRDTYMAAKDEAETWCRIVADAVTDKSADKSVLARYVARYREARALAATTLKEYAG